MAYRMWGRNLLKKSFLKRKKLIESRKNRYFPQTHKPNRMAHSKEINQTSYCGNIFDVSKIFYFKYNFLEIAIKRMKDFVASCSIILKDSINFKPFELQNYWLKSYSFLRKNVVYTVTN